MNIEQLGRPLEFHKAFPLKIIKMRQAFKIKQRGNLIVLNGRTNRRVHLFPILPRIGSIWQLGQQMSSFLSQMAAEEYATKVEKVRGIKKAIDQRETITIASGALARNLHSQHMEMLYLLRQVQLFSVLFGEKYQHSF